jgi:toxin CcdB
MAQFDVYRVDGTLLLDVQTDLLGLFPSRLVAPLRTADDIVLSPHPRLNPRLSVLGEPYILIIQHMSAVRTSILGKPVDNLDGSYDAIKSAYDMMFNGF